MEPFYYNKMNKLQQAVIRVSFVDAVEDACIDMEEANEGEQE